MRLRIQTSTENFTKKEVEEQAIDEGKDIHVNRLLKESLPKAITMDMIQYAIKEDVDLTKLLQFIKTHDSGSCKKNLPNYHGVFQELTEINQVVVRGWQIVIPKSRQPNVIAVSREGQKKVSFGDKVMVKQQKSTTKPPYDPRP